MKIERFTFCTDEINSFLSAISWGTEEEIKEEIKKLKKKYRKIK